MKKIFAALVALTLIAGAGFAENPYLADWVTAYNAKAAESSLTEIAASAFEEVSEEGYWALELEDGAIFMLSFNSDGSVYMCALQAKSADKRLETMLPCALAASDDKLSYERSAELIKSVLDKLSDTNPMSFDMLDGWYIVAAYEEVDGEGYLTLGFTGLSGMNDLPKDDTQPDNIWEGLEPDGGDEVPAPKSTPKPQDGHFKI